MLEKRLKLCALLGILGGLGLGAVGAEKTIGGTQLIADDAGAAAVDARAGAMGFAKYLPKSTHGYLGIFDGKGFADSLRSSKLAKLIQERVVEEGGPDLDEIEQNPDAQLILALLSEEIFVAVGKGVPEQAGNLVRLNESSTTHQMKFLVEMVEAQLTGKEIEGGMGMREMMMPLVGGFLRDPAGGLAILEKSQMPPLTLGFKVSDKEMRDQLAEYAKGGLGELLDNAGPDGAGFAEAVNAKRGESEFTGVKIVGKKLAALIDDDAREGMAQIMDAASIEKLIKLIETKNLVLAVGVHDKYLVGFVGTSMDELKIAASPAESILARKEMEFMKDYAGKKLLAVATMSKALQDGVTKDSTLLAGVATGIKEGLAETEGFGDTRDLEVLLELIGEQEKELLSLTSYKPAGMVAFLEEGLKIEAFGGSNIPDANLDAAHTYSTVGLQDDVFLFANWVENSDYTEKALEYLDTIGETVYLGAKHFSKLDIEEGNFDEFKEGFVMFDEKFRPHLAEVWGALRSDLVAGLGAEGAVIVDLKGGLPTVPGLPDVIIENGKAPRIGLLAPVENREKISASWKRLDGAVKELVKLASELSGEKIPMQRPMTSEKNDLTTWFFSFPFQTDDFVLSVSIDPKNFFLSTSKSFVQDLSKKLESAAADEARKGVYLEVDFTLLNGYLSDWLKLVEENAGEIFGEDSPAAADFKKELPLIKDIVGALGELKSLDAHTRKEEGTIRTSVHFKTGK